MTYIKTTKTILFGCLMALMILPLSSMDNADALEQPNMQTITEQQAQVDGVVKPSIRVIDSQLVFTWNIQVPITSAGGYATTTDNIACGKGTVSAFYYTTTDTRIVSWEIPSTINETCEVLDRFFNTNTSYALESVTYTISGDGNTSKDVTTSTSSGYDTYEDATSNSGTMLVKIIATYTHAI